MQNAAPHRLLRFPEILSAICAYSSQATQAQLVRTCKSLAEPALNALWAEGSIFKLLCRALPVGSLIISHTGRHLEVKLSPTYRLNDIHLARVAFYGVRMRYVSVRASELHPIVHLSEELLYVWRSHTQRRPYTPLPFCPHAIELCWDVQDLFSMRREIPFIVPSNVSKLTIRTFIPTHLHTLFANTLPEMPMTTLTSLAMVLNPGASSPVVDRALLLLIRRNPSLESVQLGYVSSACIWVLAELPALRKLTVGFAHDPWEVTTALKLFPALRELTVTYSPLPAVILLLRMLGGTRAITMLNIDCYSNSAALGEQILDLFDAIARHCAAATPSYLHVTDRTTITPDGANPPYAVTYQHLLSLQKFSRLEYLHILWQGYTNLDDVQVEKLAKLWPALRLLAIVPCLAYAPNWPGEVLRPHELLDVEFHTTPKCLQALASLCPHLRHLTIPFHPFPLPSPSKLGVGGRVMQQELECLVAVGGRAAWPLVSTISLAMFLSDIFPALRAFGSRMPTEYNSLLAYNVANFAAARRQERAYYANTVNMFTAMAEGYVLAIDDKITDSVL
ncbi:hypothetical protein HDZ31DRAFT_68300 [Schizophyllum fasciatum]